MNNFEKNKKTKYTIMIEDCLLEKIKNICQENNYKISGYIEHLVRIGLQKNDINLRSEK